jgi:DNA uptake protein ComE-like DNA-binding protein
MSISPLPAATLRMKGARLVLAALLLFGAASPSAGQNPAFLALTDINHASVERLRSLPGVDAALAEAIVRGRPYERPGDLLARRIVPARVFDGLKDRIIAEPR